MPVSLPGRDRDRDCLLDAYEVMVAEGKGGEIVFVSGDPGSGRSALLRSLRSEFSGATHRPQVLAGGFEDGRYRAWDVDQGAIAVALATLKGFGTLVRAACL